MGKAIRLWIFLAHRVYSIPLSEFVDLLRLVLLRVIRHTFFCSYTRYTHEVWYLCFKIKLPNICTDTDTHAQVHTKIVRLVVRFVPAGLERHRRTHTLTTQHKWCVLELDCEQVSSAIQYGG